MRGLLVAAISVILMAGCLSPPFFSDDSRPQASDEAGPPVASGDVDDRRDARGLQLVAQAAAPGGYALRVHQGRAYLATFTAEEGVSVFNVSEPSAPVHMGGIPGTLARSVDVLDYGDRVAVAISTGSRLEVWDLTDPEDPVRLASLRFGSHNVVAHPKAHVVYNARNIQDGVGGAMEIVDARDPANISLHHVWTFPATALDGSPVRNQGCHDLTIHPDQGRAYCAAYEQTLILDIENPFEPVVLTAITNPAITFHHTAFPILDHTVLAIGDEFAGNFVWGCWSHPAGAAAPQPPIGALWFYDLTVSPPQFLGYAAAPATPPEPAVIARGTVALCTSHNGVEVGRGTGIVAYGWFNAGLMLIDASDPRNPVLLDAEDPGGAVGDARWVGRHVFAADDAIGLTVFRVA